VFLGQSVWELIAVLRVGIQILVVVLRGKEFGDVDVDRFLAGD